MAGKFSTPRSTTPAPVAKAPSAPAPAAAPEATAPRKGPRTSTLIFYTAYVMLIVFFFIGMNIFLKDLDQQLVDFQKSQPGPQSAAVFEELFQKPDWGLLYDFAQIPATRFDGREEYIRYMDETFGGQSLSYDETSSGLTDTRTYTVFAGVTPIGSYTLVSIPNTEPAQWTMGSIEMFYEYKESVRVQKLSGHTVYINGVPLDDGYTVRSTSVCADEYLPRGVYSVWVHTQIVTGLMVEPQITAVDALGQPVDITYDPATDTYITGDSTTVATAEEEALALDTLKKYVRYKVDHLLTTKLDGYFDMESPFYLELLESEPWMSSNFAPTYADERITAFYRCSEDVFCIWADLTAFVKRNNGTIKEYHISHSMIFQQTESGWLCIGTTDRSAQWLEPQVRITFVNQDVCISSELYPETAATLQTPLLGSGEGSAITGWLCADTGDVYIPDSNGLVTLPEGMILKPMVLYAQYNNTNQ